VTEKLPKITALNPVVLPDRRRVTLELTVENLPAHISNVALLLPDAPAQPQAAASSPYPDVTLSILTGQRQPVASLLIVEHQEPRAALTLHLRAPNETGQYIARAEMTYRQTSLDVVEVPFTLNQAANG